MEYLKTKSAFKSVLGRGPELEKRVLDAMSTIANIVGGTLGPGGHPVLIERQEYGLPPIITKDGVTVFRALGFEDSVAHCIMEAARDASVRTATEAGDGTTTATILAEAFVRLTAKFCRENPGVSPQGVIRDIQQAYSEILEPEIARLSITSDLESEDGRRRLHAVATVSGNGDTALADAVMRCYDICGDDGNVTIVEGTGASTYEVEKIDGFPIPMGYEESCQRFYPSFINRPEIQQVHIEKPVFVLYFGRINEIQTLVPLMEKLQEAWTGEYLATPNVVIVASGFSETVLGSLTTNWVSPGSINIFPLLVPNNSPIHNAPRNFLDDLGAVVGATVFDQATKPLDTATFEDLGNIAQDPDDTKWKALGVTAIEVTRYRSTVLGFCQEDILVARAEKVKAQAEQAESELEAALIRERLAKLTGGIAKLKVVGSSSGEIKERRDRAEDAICAVRGALKAGCLPGGCWTLMRLASQLKRFQSPVNENILAPALQVPFQILLENVGIVPADSRYNNLWQTMDAFATTTSDSKEANVWNARTATWCNAVEGGLLDSTPAVREALKNAISIATLLGTLGGTIVFPRDREVEKQEARDAADFNRMSNFNPADERP